MRAAILTCVVASLLTASRSPAAPEAVSPNTVVAEVNGESITASELEAVLKQRPFPAPLSAAQVRLLQAELLEEMIQDRLVRQFLRQHGPAVEAAEVDQHFQALSASLAKQNRTVADFLRDIGQTEAQARDTWATLIQLSRYVREKVGEEQLRQYYLANKDYFDRVQLSVSHIVVRLGRGSSPADRDSARQKLQSLRDEINRGAITFADAARKHSQCPSSARGGDLGTILRKGGIMDEAFCAAAFALKPGEISNVVETEIGLHLIFARERKSGPASAFEKCLREVRESFTDEFRTELAKKLRKQAQVKILLP